MVGWGGTCIPSRESSNVPAGFGSLGHWNAPLPNTHTHTHTTCWQDIIQIVQIWWGPYIPSTLLWRTLVPYVNCPHPPSPWHSCHIVTQDIWFSSVRVSLEYHQLYGGGGAVSHQGGVHTATLNLHILHLVYLVQLAVRLVWFGKSCLWECGQQ